MTRRRTPPEKRQAAYERDHYVDAEYPHAFRRNWPRKKARLNRKVRRRAERLVRALGGPAGEVLDQAEERAVTREHLRGSLSRERVARYKWGVETLRARVGRKLRERPLSAGRSFFVQPCDAEHGEAFAAFLESLVRGRAGGARALARRFALLLEPEGKMEGYFFLDRDRRWLHAFLRDHPAWEPRLREWALRAGGGPDDASA